MDDAADIGLIERLALTEELARRRKDDPLLNFKLTEKQRPFADSCLDGRLPENWFIAANRSGKSDAGAYVGATLARFGADSGKMSIYGGGSRQIKDYSTSGWVSALDFPTNRDTIQPKYFDNGFMAPGRTHDPFIPKSEIAEWRATDQVLKLKNGSIIGFKSAESGRSKYQGAEKDWIHFDEEHPVGVFEEATFRIGARKLRVFTTCTLLPPEGMVGGISWVFPEVIQKYQEGNLPGVGMFSAATWDNPFIPAEEIARLESKYPPGTKTWRIRVAGEWIPGVAGQVAYGNFTRHVHVRDNLDIIPNLPLAWCCDFNVQPMVHVVGQRVGRTFRFLRELVIEAGNIDDVALAFREAFPTHASEVRIYGDATGRGRTAQTGQTSYFILINAMNMYPSPINLFVPESNPLVVDRLNAVNAALRSETGASWVEVDRSCKELIDDLEQVQLDPKGGIKKTYNIKDPYARRTHASDSAGYWIGFEAPVLHGGDRMQNFDVSVPRPGYGFRGGRRR